MSIHLFFCLPRLRSPCTSNFIVLLMLVSPDRSTCPYHLSLASYIITGTGLIIVLYIFLLKATVILGSHITPVRSLHFCQAVLILFLKFFLYLPVFFLFKATVILGSHIPPVRSLHFCQAVLILFLTSCSQLPVLCIIQSINQSV